MLTLTENASTVVKTIVDQSGGDPTAGLRISQDAVDSPALHVITAEAPQPGDQVLEEDGAGSSSRRPPPGPSTTRSSTPRSPTAGAWSSRSRRRPADPPRARRRPRTSVRGRRGAQVSRSGAVAAGSRPGTGLVPGTPPPGGTWPAVPACCPPWNCPGGRPVRPGGPKPPRPPGPPDEPPLLAAASAAPPAPLSATAVIAAAASVRRDHTRAAVRETPIGVGGRVARGRRRRGCLVCLVVHVGQPPANGCAEPVSRLARRCDPLSQEAHSEVLEFPHPPRRSCAHAADNSAPTSPAPTAPRCGCSSSTTR